MCVCVRACLRACVPACVRACVRVCGRAHGNAIPPHTHTHTHTQYAHTHARVHTKHTRRWGPNPRGDDVPDVVFPKGAGLAYPGTAAATLQAINTADPWAFWKVGRERGGAFWKVGRERGGLLEGGSVAGEGAFWKVGRERGGVAWRGVSAGRARVCFRCRAASMEWDYGIQLY